MFLERTGNTYASFLRFYFAHPHSRHILTCLNLEFQSRFGDPAFEATGQRRDAHCG